MTEQPTCSRDRAVFGVMGRTYDAKRLGTRHDSMRNLDHDTAATGGKLQSLALWRLTKSRISFRQRAQRPAARASEVASFAACARFEWQRLRASQDDQQPDPM